MNPKIAVCTSCGLSSHCYQRHSTVCSGNQCWENGRWMSSGTPGSRVTTVETLVVNIHACTSYDTEEHVRQSWKVRLSYSKSLATHWKVQESSEQPHTLGETLCSQGRSARQTLCSTESISGVLACKVCVASHQTAHSILSHSALPEYVFFFLPRDTQFPWLQAACTEKPNQKLSRRANNLNENIPKINSRENNGRKEATVRKRQEEIRNRQQQHKMQASKKKSTRTREIEIDKSVLLLCRPYHSSFLSIPSSSVLSPTAVLLLPAPLIRFLLILFVACVASFHGARKSWAFFTS